MKTFTATQLNKSPQEIFAAAKDEPVYIKHDRYECGFILAWDEDNTELYKEHGVSYE